MKQLFLIFFLLLQSSAVSAFSYTLELTEGELQEKAEALMPLEKRKFFITTILSNPNIDLTNGSSEIDLSTDVQVTAPGNITGKGSVNFTGSIRYENKSGSFFFDNLKVISLDIKQVPEATLPKIRKMLEFVAKKFLAVKPIFTFKDDSLKHKLAKATLKSVTVENEKLLVELGVF